MATDITAPAPTIVDRAGYQAELDRLRSPCSPATCATVFETYWTTGRGVEIMAPTHGLVDRTVYGRQEPWEDSPAGWPRDAGYASWRTDGRPTAQWSRLHAGHSDDLGTERH